MNLSTKSLTLACSLANLQFHFAWGNTNIQIKSTLCYAVYYQMNRVKPYCLYYYRIAVFKLKTQSTK